VTTSHEAAAQEGLRTAALELKRVRERLKRIVDALPLSAQEQEPEDLNQGQEPDVTTEIRRVVLCVLRDSLDPAIADLIAASEYRPHRPGDA
jgi:hypothetical protein